MSMKFEGGEDTLQNFITNDKNIIFSHNAAITDEDIKQIPALKSLRESIQETEEQLLKATVPQDKLTIKRQLISMYQDQYVIKTAYKKPIYCINKSYALPQPISLSRNITIDECGNIQDDSLISFFNENHVSMLLCHYKRAYAEVMNTTQSDLKYLIEDFSELVYRTLHAKYPLYYSLVQFKTAGMFNNDIQEALYKKHGIKHTVEYISALWRKKIPKLIVEQATKEYLEYHYTFKEKGKWKKCSYCGEIKLAHSMFFSKNKSSKDGYYSLCKKCRAAKHASKTAAGGE